MDLFDLWGLYVDMDGFVLNGIDFVWKWVDLCVLYFIIILGRRGEKLFAENVWPPPVAKASYRRPLSTPRGECASHGEGIESEHKSKINVFVF
jgi:hypothetical protein